MRGMRHASPWILVAGLFGSPVAQEERPPIETDKVEEELVRLVVLDTIVVDRSGRTVGDLTIDDFEIVAGGKPVPVGSLDVDCPGGGAAQPEAVSHARKRQAPAAGDKPRRLVLAVDYLHLSFSNRAEVLLRARELVKHNAGSGDEVMVVALNGGLRIEQPFTTNPTEVLDSIERMEHDITLWQPDYFHLSENQFIDPLVGLLDLLGTFEGTKAVVLFSTMRDVPLDKQFERVAAIAALSRCSIYPVDAGGLRVLETGTSRAAAAGGPG